ncbi:hypothetical protein JXQ31_18415 [candidate division KSB1 bacterium]|nr:hypothetical protein [candidate division KSB1 bacterium]
MRYGIIFLILLMVVPAFSQPANINILLIKEWDKDIVDPVYDNIYDALSKRVLENKFLNTIRKIDFEYQTGLVLNSIFADINDPFKLYELNQRLDLDVVVLLSVSQGDFMIQVLEFPSGLSIDRLIIGKDELVNNGIDKTLQSKVDPLFNKLVNNNSANGYPFSSIDYGIVVFADDIKDEQFTQEINQMRKYYNNKIAQNNKRLFRIKIINQKTDCTGTSALCVEIGAEFALLNDIVDTRVNTSGNMIVFPSLAFDKPLIDVELPCLPNEEQFACFNWNGSGFNTDQLCDNIFNEAINFNEIKDTPVVLHKLLKMHKYWVNKIENTTIDPDHINDYYLLLYNHLPVNSIEKAWVGLNYAGYYYETGQYILANSMLTETYTNFRENTCVDGMLLSLLAKARVAVLLKQWPNAITWYESVLKIKEINRDNLTVAGIQYNLGLINEITGNLDKAIYHYESSALLFNNSTNVFESIQIYNKICRLLRETGQYDKALDYSNIYLTRANELHSEPDIANARYEMGMVKFEKKDYKQAFNDLTIAQSFYDLLDENSNNLALIHLKLGIINFKGKKYPDANKNFKASLNLATEIENSEDVIDCYRYMGDIEVINKKWLVAQNYYDQGLKVAMQINMNPAIAELIYKKGLAHLYEGHVAVGYEEVKKGIELSNGEVHGGQKNADAFLNKLEKAIKD